MPSPSLGSDLLALQTSLASLCSLLASFQSALRAPLESPRPNHIANPPNALALLSDAAQLLKAQTTKLSLLILNKPFSAREVNHIISVLSKSILPALLSASDLLRPETYTRAVQWHVRGILGIVWRELLKLFDIVPTDAEPDVKRVDIMPTHTEPDVKRVAALGSTGVLWEQCDELVSLGEIGVTGVVDRRVKGYGELLDDAIAEMEEWDPDEDDGDSDGDEDEGGEEGNSQKGKAMVATPTTSDEEALQNGVQGLRLSPHNAVKAKVLKFLRILRLFYPALRKRRIETYPNITRKSTKDDLISSQQVERLDELVGFAQQFSEDTDELAGALYADETEEVDIKLRALTVASEQCALLMETDWNGQEDEFCTWLRTWKDLLRGALTI